MLPSLPWWKATASAALIRSVERMTRIHRDTIMRLIGRVGERCANVMDERMRNVRCQEIEADEIWCFVGKKQRRLTDTDKVAG